MSDDVSLKEYVERRFDGLEKSIAVALASAEKAVLKAETATDKRLEGMNEFRAALADQQRTLMPRSEVELLVKGVTDRLKVIEDARTAKAGEGSGAKNLWAIIVAVLGVVALVVGLLARFL